MCCVSSGAPKWVGLGWARCAERTVIAALLTCRPPEGQAAQYAAHMLIDQPMMHTRYHQPGGTHVWPCGRLCV